MHALRVNRTVVVPRGPRLTGAAWDAALGGLPEGERRRVAAYRHWENQQDSVLGWHLLADLAGAERLRRDDNGRPKAAPPMDVSLSHSGGWIAAASSPQGRIGIDVEAEREVSVTLPRRCLAPSELVWLTAAIPGPRQRERFFLLWTAKEAYVKATGVGIQTYLRYVVIDHSGDEPRLAGSERDQWRFTVTSPAPQVWVTVCSERTA